MPLLQKTVQPRLLTARHMWDAVVMHLLAAPRAM